MSESPLDEIDRAILYRLQHDGRQTITDIADVLGVADNTVRNRMQELEDAGIISGYRVNVNYDQAGIQHYYMFACTARVSRREDLAADVRSLPGVIEVITLMTGSDNVYVIGASPTKNAISELAYAIDELGLSVEREHLIRDHVKQPYSGFQPPEYLPQN